MVKGRQHRPSLTTDPSLLKGVRVPVPVVSGPLVPRGAEAGSRGSGGRRAPLCACSCCGTSGSGSGRLPVQSASASPSPPPTAGAGSGVTEASAGLFPAREPRHRLLSALCPPRPFSAACRSLGLGLCSDPQPCPIRFTPWVSSDLLDLGRTSRVRGLPLPGL